MKSHAPFRLHPSPLLLLSAILALMTGIRPARSHPLQAEPIEHAHVFSFEQFFLPEDDDDYLTNGGLLLLGELHCTVCHAPPPAWKDLIGAKPGPDLRDVGNRLDADSLWRLIRSPQHHKRGTQMPGLFAGEEGDAEAVEALATYLVTLRQPGSGQSPPEGDANTGRQLYHRIGCLACHQPGSDYRPDGLGLDEEIESPGLPSIPLALADDYSLHALSSFLLDPLASRPSGRMPSQHLTPQEAADIAAYLHTDRVAPAFFERQILQLAAQTPETGRVLFVERRCSACHQAEEEAPPPRLSLPLTQLRPQAEEGCLTAEIRSGVPRYDLKPVHKRALLLALAAVQSAQDTSPSAAVVVDMQLARFNCYACHDRDGKGGPEEPRAAFMARQARDRPNDDWDHLPPTLDGIGTRMDAAQLEHRIAHPQGLAPEPKPSEGTRMPCFGAESTEALRRALIEASNTPP